MIPELLAPDRPHRARNFTAGLLTFFAIMAPCVGASAAWNTREISDKSYVALSDVATVYGMQPMEKRKDPKELGFKGEKHSLIVKIDSRQALIDGVRHWLSFPLVSYAGKPCLSLIDLESTVIPAFAPGSVDEVKPVKTIVFDPGHGGHDRGARSPLGYEKDYALDVVRRTRRILENRGIKVVQNRLTDFFVNLHERPSMTKNYEDPVFVSIHFNAASWKPSANGFEIYTLPPSGAPPTGLPADTEDDVREHPGTPHEPASFVMANTIYQTLLGKMDGFDRGVKRARFSVLRHAEVPAVLIEGGFLSNPKEAKQIHSSAWRERYATALADGIEAYMNLANKEVQPPRAVDLKRQPTDEFVPEK